MSFYDNLSERGFIEQTSSEKIPEILNNAADPISFYIGFDPTADSLHLGHLIPVMSLIHGQRAGHRPLVLVGGATAMIGDPSGKSEERNLLTLETVQENLEGVKKQLSKLLSFEGDSGAKLVNNYDWISKFGYIEWLRDVGKHFTIANMIAKESVKKRMDNKTSGLSYTEFSYQMLQSYDFYHLAKEENCVLQAGGSDQWGNITAGIDLVRRKLGKEVYGMTYPLLTTAKGEKFGKSAGNAVWIDSERTSVWDFYQYWVNAADADAIKFLKLFTLLPVSEIVELAKETETNPGARAAQKKLAHEATSLMHSATDADECINAAQALFKGNLAELPTHLIKGVLSGNGYTVPKEKLSGDLTILGLAKEAGLFPSMGEARRKLKEGAVYLNDQKLDEDNAAKPEHILKDDIILLRMGKKKYALVVVE